MTSLKVLKFKVHAIISFAAAVSPSGLSLAVWSLGIFPAEQVTLRVLCIVLKVLKIATNSLIFIF